MKQVIKLKKNIKIAAITAILLCVISISVFAIYQYINYKTIAVESLPIESEPEIHSINLSTLIVQGNSTIALEVGDQYEDEGCVAYDEKGNDITNKVRIIGEINTKKKGDYRITYILEDDAGNKLESYRDIKVEKPKKQETIPTSSNNASKVNKNTRGLPVLMYHFFYDASKGQKGKDNNWMEISDFEKQMKYLSENNFYFPSWTEVRAYVDGKKTLPNNSVVITVDDGDESFLKLAIPIINKYNIPVTSFLVTGWNGDWVVPQYKFSKVDFQSHSHNMHKAGKDGKGIFLTLSYDKAYQDVKKSREIIGGATVFCYPFGHYNQTTKKILKEAGYTLAFTTKGGRVYSGMDPYTLPRIRMSKGDSLNTFKERVK